MCKTNPQHAADRRDGSWVVLTLHDKAIRFTPVASPDGILIGLEFEVHGVEDAAGPTLTDGIALSDWRESESEMHGRLKWDGCIDWRTTGEMMMHGCGPRHAVQICAVLEAVYHVGRRHMDLLDIAVPAMPEGAVEIIEGDGAAVPPRRLMAG